MIFMRKRLFHFTWCAFAYIRYIPTTNAAIINHTFLPSRYLL